LVTVAWLRLTLVDSLEIATAPSSWMACNTNSWGAVSPDFLLSCLEYKSVARIICLIVIRTSISWLRGFTPKCCLIWVVVASHTLAEPLFWPRR
jgi:hypothetical protein